MLEIQSEKVGCQITTNRHLAPGEEHSLNCGSGSGSGSR